MIYEVFNWSESVNPTFARGISHITWFTYLQPYNSLILPKGSDLPPNTTPQVKCSDEMNGRHSVALNTRKPDTQKAKNSAPKTLT